MRFLKKLKSRAFQAKLAVQNLNQHLPFIKDKTCILVDSVDELLREIRFSSPNTSFRPYRATYDSSGTIKLPAVPQPYVANNMENTLEELMKVVPKACALWTECQKEGLETYLADPKHNLSVAGHPLAELFRAFVKPYLEGYVLDIGCGTQDVPYYLSHHPLEYIAGIDPLPPTETHPFAFSQALAERLPWPDDTFHRVTVATSLDHMILLDQAFNEVKRVLKPGGFFIAWVGFLPKAAPYDPYSPDLKRIDPCHIFHFDRRGFEKVIKDHFDIQHCYEVFYQKEKEIFDCFYLLSPKKNVSK